MPSVPKAESVSNSYCIACGFLELYYMAGPFFLFSLFSRPPARSLSQNKKRKAFEILNSKPSFQTIAAYAMYDFYVKNDVGEEGEKWTMLMGIASAGQLILYAVEMVLGFCNCDDNKIWGFLFMIGSAAMVVFSIASASYCLDKEAIVTYATLVRLSFASPQLLA